MAEDKFDGSSLSAIDAFNAILKELNGLKQRFTELELKHNGLATQPGSASSASGNIIVEEKKAEVFIS
jgi:hypothetical protein